MVGPQDVIEVVGEPGRVVAEPLARLSVVASGPGWVAVDKPAGVAVHPLRDGETGTVLNALAARWPAVQGVGGSGGEGGLRSGVVHRLDVETSGVLLFALDEPTWSLVREAFAQHQTRKLYTAVVSGRIEAEGRADVWLKVTRHRPARVEAVTDMTPGARRCGLSWQLVKSLDGASVVEIELETGFLHQVRVTFSHLGHPLVGDVTYGETRRVTIAGAKRHMLHASRLEIGSIAATSPMPRDMAAVIEALGR